MTDQKTSSPNQKGPRAPFFRLDGSVSTDPEQRRMYPPPRELAWEYWSVPSGRRGDLRAIAASSDVRHRLLSRVSR